MIWILYTKLGLWGSDNVASALTEINLQIALLCFCRNAWKQTQKHTTFPYLEQWTHLLNWWDYFLISYIELVRLFPYLIHWTGETISLSHTLNSGDYFLISYIELVRLFPYLIHWTGETISLSHTLNWWDYFLISYIELVRLFPYLIHWTGETISLSHTLNWWDYFPISYIELVRLFSNCPPPVHCNISCLLLWLQTILDSSDSPWRFRTIQFQTRSMSFFTWSCFVSSEFHYYLSDWLFKLQTQCSWI